MLSISTRSIIVLLIRRIELLEENYGRNTFPGATCRSERQLYARKNLNYVCKQTTLARFPRVLRKFSLVAVDIHFVSSEVDSSSDLNLRPQIPSSDLPMEYGGGFTTNDQLFSDPKNLAYPTIHGSKTQSATAFLPF